MWFRWWSPGESNRSIGACEVQPVPRKTHGETFLSEASLLDQMRLFLFMLSVFVSGCGREPATAPAPATTSTTATTAVPAAPRSPSRSNRAKPIKSFTVYTLSRGTGVPPEARDVLEQVTNLVEADRKRGVKVTIQTARIGIEGEQRLCAEYEDAQEGARAFERARAIAAGVDLVHLVAEPCGAPAPAAETQK